MPLDSDGWECATAYHWLHYHAEVGWIVVARTVGDALEGFNMPVPFAGLPYFFHPQEQVRANALTQAARACETTPVEGI